MNYELKCNFVSMKVLIVSTSEKIGGAAIAARRLLQALNKNGVHAKMLVRDKQTDDVKVVKTGSLLSDKLHFVSERAWILLHNRLSRQNLWSIDTGSDGTDITTLPEFREADVIHLHWINQGFLSLDSLKKIFSSGKRVVWTMHDMWPCTSICHHAGQCRGYETHCCNCHLLQSHGRHDLSYKVFEQKLKALSCTTQGGTIMGSPLRFVACSCWLEEQARKSALLHNFDVTCIPNPLDTHVFCPEDKVKARTLLNLPLDKKLLLFGSLKVTDKRKGIDYLVVSADILAQTDNDIALVVMGQKSEELQKLLPLPVYSMGYVTDDHQLAHIYNAVDAFVTPSLFENLPNTIAEAMSCGTPCVGFNVGGIPEMIHHKKDGYVAEYKNSKDLAEGIQYVLSHPELGEAAIHSAVGSYSETRVAQRYIKIYEE